VTGRGLLEWAGKTAVIMITARIQTTVMFLRIGFLRVLLGSSLPKRNYTMERFDFKVLCDGSFKRVMGSFTQSR
jgi:hypothetical protein